MMSSTAKEKMTASEVEAGKAMLQQLRDAGYSIPLPLIDRMAVEMAPSTQAANQEANQKEAALRCQDMMVGKIVHVCHSDDQWALHQWWLVLHYRVMDRTEDENTIRVRLQRCTPDAVLPALDPWGLAFPVFDAECMPENVLHVSWDKTHRISTLPRCHNDWDFDAGVRSEITTLWPHLHVGLACDPATCRNHTRDGFYEFYFGP